ncbi:hypothetical protein CLV63_109181 [Murinocardiopsis flavida]|uniref:Uncharacterized protein n=1 Tax=Murinocardiopsis flavida TaxID=645275 RepID=A0A2P8DIW8_9ACTN|nr:hypothetical protein [Murinocardiopsis flavida]PSK97177.1 hypothetical protein CLV63_109181 [Murinocardiopsis flavida]
MDDDAAIAAGFRRLLHEQGLDRLDTFREPLSTFDEPPLYARYDQLGFLDGLPVPERNRRLIRAAAAHLRAIVAHISGHGTWCMLAIHGWEGFDAGGLLRPTFCTASLESRPDPRDPRTVLDYLRFDPPQSRFSAFTAHALADTPDCAIEEDLVSTPGVQRVYVRLGRYWSAAYQAHR